MEPASEKALMFPALQQQKNSSDCGLFTIAFDAAIIMGDNVETAGLELQKIALFFSNLVKPFDYGHFPAHLLVISVSLR